MISGGYLLVSGGYPLISRENQLIMNNFFPCKNFEILISDSYFYDNSLILETHLNLKFITFVILDPLILRGYPLISGGYPLVSGGFPLKLGGYPLKSRETKSPHIVKIRGKSKVVLGICVKGDNLFRILLSPAAHTASTIASRQL